MKLCRSDFGGALTAPLLIKRTVFLLLLAGMAGTMRVDAAPPIVKTPSGAKVKTYAKPLPKAQANQRSPHGHRRDGVKRSSRVVVIPKQPVITTRSPQVSSIATPFPDPSIKSYPTKVEVRSALPSSGPVFPLTRFSQFGRPKSSFRPQPFAPPSARQFLGLQPHASGFVRNDTPSPSAITSTKSISSFTPLPKTVVPTHPSGIVIRSGHPARPEKWQKLQDHCVSEWKGWHEKHEAHLSSIKSNRMKNWGHVCSRYREPGWARHFHGKEYRKWCKDLWDYRRDRCVEVWCARKPFWNHVFDNDWWGACWWRSHPDKYVRGGHESPWWWWKRCERDEMRTFFGVALAVPAVIYDPGATVLYDGTNYYVDGELSATALEARQQAIELANPDISGIPLPDPAPEGEKEMWLPLGVWALAQQQQGEPTMFMQLSVNKEGIVAGAYKNILTGDEQPIVGRVDMQSQRVAWHVGDATQTVYETGLTSLENDVASVFVHFGTDATQTWLLVRLPSPEMPPGPSKTPEVN